MRGRALMRSSAASAQRQQTQSLKVMYVVVTVPPTSSSDVDRSTPESGSLPSVVIAAATFRRPEALERLLPEVVRQSEAYAGESFVLIVDNDPAGGAAGQVGAWASRGVRYVHEPHPGIAAARNRALAEGAAADLLAFIDDDGLPLDGWLQHLVDTWLRYRSAGVSGPVLARFESGEPEPWVANSGVFDRTIRTTGTLVGGAGSGNLLLDLSQLRDRNLTFDEEFGLSGGSDTMLTHALIKDGGQIRWCDEAEIYDYHSADRLSRRWVVKRSFRTGNDWSRVALALTRSPRERLAESAELTARGLWIAGRGLLRSLLGLRALRRPASRHRSLPGGVGGRRAHRSLRLHLDRVQAPAQPEPSAAPTQQSADLTDFGPLAG